MKKNRDGPEYEVSEGINNARGDPFIGINNRSRALVLLFIFNYLTGYS